MAGEEARKQGYFDYLCGLYAIINACNQVGGLGDGDDEVVFKDFVKHINRRNKLYTALTIGMEFEEMRLLLDRVRKKYKIDYDIPSSKSDKIDLSEFISKCSGALSKNQSIIVFLKKIPLNYPEPSIRDIDHWTVIDDISNQKVHLFDSYGFESINLKDLEQICQIDFSYTFFIKKR